MSQTITCAASPTSWNEDRSQTTTPRVTPAEVVLTLSSATPSESAAASAQKVDATTATSYQMTYLPSGNASFVFTETVKASSFLGKQGSFITQGEGTFDAASFVVKGEFGIVEGSGTGGLKGIKGKGTFDPLATGSKHLRYVFEVEGVVGSSD